MKIFLIRGGKSTGPFQAGELRQKINSGGVSPSELAWGAGLDEWARLEQVLDRAERMSAAGKQDPVDEQGVTPPPIPDSSLREKSTKLQPISGAASSLKPPVHAGVQSVADTEEKQREAKRSGAASSVRPNAFGPLRWIGVLAVLVFLVAAFMPWVRTTTAAGRTELSAVNIVLASEEQVALPGKSVAPKYFGLSKMVLIVALVFLLLSGLISVTNIFSREADNSGMGILISGALLLAMIFIGVVYGHFFEREFNTALGVKDGVSFEMDYGFYFSLASVVLIVGCLMIPKVVAGPFVPVMVPFLVSILFAAGLGGFGILLMESRSPLEKAFSDVKQLLPASPAQSKNTNVDGVTGEVPPSENQ